MIHKEHNLLITLIFQKKNINGTIPAQDMSNGLQFCSLKDANFTSEEQKSMGYYTMQEATKSSSRNR
jgi:hypothetical protein